jgi:UDP-N-acetylglucosamine 2-epimerase (non-hydrolysing)
MHGSTYLFAPTPKPREILLHEGIAENQIFMVGNTIVDALHQNLKIAESKTQILNQLCLGEGKFMLATSHRQENVDDKGRFAGLIEGLQLVQSEFGVPLVYPIHPRAKKQLELFGIDTGGLTLVEPLDYLAFLKLESKAKLVLTDSGGVQEETCILGVPCITLRDNTGRPETLEVGSNLLAGTDPDKILEAAKVSCAQKKAWGNPFGDGKTGSKIINALRDELR